jgi:hypothetical protein
MPMGSARDESYALAVLGTLLSILCKGNVRGSIRHTRANGGSR